MMIFTANSKFEASNMFLKSWDGVKIRQEKLSGTENKTKEGTSQLITLT